MPAKSEKITSIPLFFRSSVSANNYHFYFHFFNLFFSYFQIEFYRRNKSFALFNLSSINKSTKHEKKEKKEENTRDRKEERKKEETGKSPLSILCKGNILLFFMNEQYLLSINIQQAFPGESARFFMAFLVTKMIFSIRLFFQQIPLLQAKLRL